MVRWTIVLALPRPGLASFPTKATLCSGGGRESGRQMAETRSRDHDAVANIFRDETAECQRLAQLERIFSKRLRLESLARSYEKIAETVRLKMLKIEPARRERSTRRKKVAS